MRKVSKIGTFLFFINPMSKDSRDNILKRLAKATAQKSPIPYPEIVDSKDIFYGETPELLQLFKEQFNTLSGIFYLCKTHQELLESIDQHCEHINDEHIFCADAKLIHLLHNAGFSRKLNGSLSIPEASLCISSCISLVARTGSILFSSVQAEGRSHAIAPDTQIVIAFKNQLLYNVGQALSAHTEKYSELPSMISLTSGASRTADIEKTLVMGAHGPKELIVIMLDLD